TIQYADWAKWQHDRLDAGCVDRELDFWRGRLAGAPDFLELPADRPRPAVPSHRGAMLHFTVPSQLADALHRFAQETGCTLYMVLFAAFVTLIGRYARQHDFVVGTPVTNRASKEVEGVIGIFINTLPLRADLTGSPSVRALLARVRQTVLDAQTNAEVPLERLIE